MSCRFWKTKIQKNPLRNVGGVAGQTYYVGSHGATNKFIQRLTYKKKMKLAQKLVINKKNPQF